MSFDDWIEESIELYRTRANRIRNMLNDPNFQGNRESLEKENQFSLDRLAYWRAVQRERA